MFSRLRNLINYLICCIFTTFRASLTTDLQCPWSLHIMLSGVFVTEILWSANGACPSDEFAIQDIVIVIRPLAIRRM